MAYPSSHSFGRPIEHRYKKRRNVSFHGRYGKNEYIRTKSHSLNAILEELYSLGPEDGGEEGTRKINYETGRPLIPRIKLKRSTSSLKEDRNYSTLYKMSSESEIFIRGNSNTSTPNIILRNENNDIDAKVSESNISILLNDQSYDEISRKSDENYFAKNFDDCMKRLQLIEKEHELIEKADGDLQLCTLQNDKEDIQINAAEINEIPSTEAIYNYEMDYGNKNSGNGSDEAKLMENERKPENLCTEKTEKEENYLLQKSMPTDTTKKKMDGDDTCLEEKIEESIPGNWYSNLKQQFEKKERDTHEQKTKEMSCRITGATLKSQNEKTKSDEDKEKETRHYFSRLVKTNKSLIDEELPDPDKVKHIRAMFQENLNSTLKRRLDKKLGGSLQNISVRPSTEQPMNRPLSAQCYRNEMFCEAGTNQKSDEEKTTTARETSKPSKVGNGEFQIENTKKKLFEKYEKDLKPGRDYRSRRVLQPKWTDTGSVSSGIGSDLSSYDTDLECYSREGTEQDEMTMSDDDLLEEVKDKHYVQNEVLEKIRSFGTSVTYYGGEMITCSVGPLLSPTTQAIIEEITEMYGHEKNPSRSFDEFYRKYVEMNEPNRKKKVGRTRSFGQNDVFQKPNVLSNTEIDMYKNDLEIEIGIKKPAGIQQNSLKRKVTKSASLGCNNAEVSDNEVCSQILTNNSQTVENSEKEVAQASFDCMEGDDNKAVTENTNNNEIKMPIPKASTERTETENKCEPETEYKPGVNEEEKSSKTTSGKEPSFFRSKSLPEGGKNTANKCEVILNDIDHPAKEIFFSYEKSLFNGKRNSDMEFEEFEVCESLSEKLEKLEKLNPHEKSIDKQEVLPSANIEGKLKKPFETDGDERKEQEEEAGVSLTTAAVENQAKETEEKHVMEISIGGENENVQSEKKDSRSNHSRWPIETTVMVDIQKNNEQTPKIITSGKTVAKTKIRLF